MQILTLSPQISNTLRALQLPEPSSASCIPPNILLAIAQRVPSLEHQVQALQQDCNNHQGYLQQKFSQLRQLLLDAELRHRHDASAIALTGITPTISLRKKSQSRRYQRTVTKDIDTAVAPLRARYKLLRLTQQDLERTTALLKESTVIDKLWQVMVRLDSPDSFLSFIGQFPVICSLKGIFCLLVPESTNIGVEQLRKILSQTIGPLLGNQTSAISFFPLGTTSAASLPDRLSKEILQLLQSFLRKYPLKFSQGETPHA